MPERPTVTKRFPPAAFTRYRQTRFERTVRLTEQAIAQLETQGQTVTLTAVCEATREFDAGHKGIRPITILRNPQAAELFRQHSPAYQARQQQAKRAKRKQVKTKVGADLRATYAGLRPADLILIVEDLKTQIADLKAQQARLQSERDEAYRWRDEALRQNTRQLAALTRLTSPVALAGGRP